MLTALETGVKGEVWFSLIDKVFASATLRSAFARVKANDGAAGTDMQSIAMFENHLEANLESISSELRPLDTGVRKRMQIDIAFESARRLRL